MFLENGAFFACFDIRICRAISTLIPILREFFLKKVAVERLRPKLKNGETITSFHHFLIKKQTTISPYKNSMSFSAFNLHFDFYFEKCSYSKCVHSTTALLSKIFNCLAAVEVMRNSTLSNSPASGKRSNTLR